MRLICLFILNPFKGLLPGSLLQYFSSLLLPLPQLGFSSRTLKDLRPNLEIIGRKAGPSLFLPRIVDTVLFGVRSSRSLDARGYWQPRDSSFCDRREPNPGYL